MIWVWILIGFVVGEGSMAGVWYWIMLCTFSGMVNCDLNAAAAVAGMSQEAIAELEKNGKYTFMLEGITALMTGYNEVHYIIPTI